MVAEAQIRLFRREGLPVLSQVWDLYGQPNEAVVEDRTLSYGATSTGPHTLATPPGERAATRNGGSVCVYQRVNLRALGGDELLARGPPALWPLVALTRDGTGEAMIHKALDAIEGRDFRTSAERADHLAVPWFVAEAEDVPVQVLRAYISEERLLQSTLYQSAFAKGEAQGEAPGEARAEIRMCIETIVVLLGRWLGILDPALAERIGAVTDRSTLRAWQLEAIYLSDADGARRLAEKIQQAPLP